MIDPKAATIIDELLCALGRRGLALLPDTPTVSAAMEYVAQAHGEGHPITAALADEIRRRQIKPPALEKR